MIFQIAHTTTYTFSRPVFLEPHAIRLRPRSDASQRLIRFDLQIDPKPAGISEGLDLEGNGVAHAWFEGVADSLQIATRCEVQTRRENPFDFIVSGPSAGRLPVEYADDLLPSLAPYRSREGSDAGVADFAGFIAKEAGGQSLPFLVALTRRIHETCEVILREEGGPQPSGMTLRERRGACRDLAVLFLEACRAQGFGARFVSGYQAGAPDQERRYLHAWAEVFLPGGGWRGYDPSLGLAVADRHVALAAGARADLAAPIAGTFRGTGISSRMRAEVHIHVSDRPKP